MTDHPDMSEPVEVIAAEVAAMVERLQAKHDTGRRTLGGGFVTVADPLTGKGGTSGMWGSDPIYATTNPDGAAASALLLKLLHRLQHSASVPEGWEDERKRLRDVVRRACNIMPGHYHKWMEDAENALLPAVPPAPAPENIEGQASPEFLRRVMRHGWETAEAPHDAPGLADPASAPRDEVRAEVECHGLDTPERVCFYEQDYYVLSNFSAFAVKWGPYTFPTSEHLYHWRRFFLAGHAAADAIADRIYRASSAHAAFKLAQEHKHLQVERWDELKVAEMRGILTDKAEQHEYVRRKLLATGSRELVENSWRDSYWGWGPDNNGQNMLGKLWMEVRATLAANRGGE